MAPASTAGVPTKADLSGAWSLGTPHLPAIASAEGRGWPGWEVEGFYSRSRRLWWSPSREEADSIVGEIVF